MGIVNLLGGNVATIGSQFRMFWLTALRTAYAPAATDAAVGLRGSDFTR